MKYYSKLFTILIVAFLIAGMLTGCQRAKEDTYTPVESGELFVDNPFETGGNSTTEIVGALGHGPENPVLRDDGTRAPYEYHGGQFELNYHVKASGTAKNVGFLLFLNGIPQPYQIDGKGNMQYMNMFELEKDDQQYPFSFVFTPVTGTMGDTLELKIYSVFNPQFQPDMVTTSSYGLYYNTLEATIEVAFQASPDVDESTTKIEPLLSSVTVRSDDMTSDFVSNRLTKDLTGNGKSAMDQLEDSVFCFTDYNGESAIDNIDISNQGTLHITYQMVGVPGAAYRISLFGNNQPLTDGEALSWEVALSKGKVAVLEADIDIASLDDFTTFYIFACPVDRGGASDSVVLLGEMHGPILLYKGVSK